MSETFWLTDEEFDKISPLLPNTPRGVPRVDDQRGLSGIIFCLQRGDRRSDVPSEYGPAKPLCNRDRRWSEAGVLARIFEALTQDGADFALLMIDANPIKTHRIVANGATETAAQAERSVKSKAGWTPGCIWSAMDSAAPCPSRSRQATGLIFRKLASALSHLCA